MRYSQPSEEDLAEKRDDLEEERNQAEAALTELFEARHTTETMS